MSLEYTLITRFQALHDGAAVIVLGLGDDGWMYQYAGDNGSWERLSKKFPKTINLPGSEAETFSASTLEEPPKEATGSTEPNLS